MSEYANLSQSGENAILAIGSTTHKFVGQWLTGSAWERFGLYDTYVVAHPDGTAYAFPAHSGELVPGSTEDIAAYLREQWGNWRHPTCPLTLELDPTYACASHDCGTRCFSAAYRRLQPNATIPGAILKEILEEFARNGGKIVRFDGGGDPLLHPDVRSGLLTIYAQTLHLKSTILTAGDLLPLANLDAIAASTCYVRLSVDASAEETRKRFHGNNVSLLAIHRAIERLAGILANQPDSVPIGATFLLDEINCAEVLDCAKRCRDNGVRHFSVRRVLGPESLRPKFSELQIERIAVLLNQVEQLQTCDFRVFVPWRPVGEADLSPKQGQITSSTCWQSTFKTVIEPTINADNFGLQLCGRYRGGGVGQAMQMPPLAVMSSGRSWTADWRQSFRTYPVSRPALIGHCVSCIDRGFIGMVEHLVNAIEGKTKEFEIFHLGKHARRTPDVVNRAR